VPVVVALAIAGTLLVVAALGGLVGAAPWALGVLASGYVLVLLAQGEPVVAAPFYGAGLLLVAELTYASRELARGAEEAPERRLVWLAAVAAGSLAVATLPVAATAVSPPTGTAAEVVAAVAAVLLVAAPALVLRRASLPVPRRRS
jgi:hypothetical protein